MTRKFEGKNNPFYGKHHTIKTKKRLSKHRKGKTYEFNNKGRILNKILRFIK